VARAPPIPARIFGAEERWRLGSTPHQVVADPRAASVETANEIANKSLPMRCRASPNCC